MVLVSGLAGLAAAQVPPVTVTVEFGGNLSLPVTVVVAGTLGCLVSVSSTASMTGVVTVPVQAGAPVHRGSPPPVAVALLVLGLAVAAPTVTGTVITMLPVAAPAAIEQPVVLVAPAAGQPLKVPPVAVINPLVTMPVGKLSANVIAAVVGPLATAMLML